MARHTGAPGLLPRGRGLHPREHQRLRALPGLRAVRVLLAREDGQGRRQAHARRLRDRRDRHPRPQPGPRDVLDPRREGDLLRRRALPGLDRPHRPARRRPRDAAALDRDAAGHAARTRPACCPATCRPTTLGAERATQSVPARARATGEPEIQAPRGTYDVLPDLADERARLETTAAQDPRARRLRPHRDADLRGHAALQPHGGRGDRRRPEGDVHLPGRERGQPDAAPGGHRAGRARLPRARHAQGAAAGEAVVPVELLPLRAPAGRAASGSSGRSGRRRSAPRTRRSTPR